MSSVLEKITNVIPAAAGTRLRVQRASGEPYRDHVVVAWASFNNKPMEALVTLNDTGELTPLSAVRDEVEDLYIVHPGED